MKDDGQVTRTTKILDCTANPAPIALMGFGMTTILLSAVNAGLVPLGAAVLAMGIFFGGLAQVIVGFLEWKKGNTFGATTFVSFGFFWIVLIVMMILPKLGLAAVDTGEGKGLIFGSMGFFTLYMTIGTINTNRVLQLTFASLTVVFFMLALGDAFVIKDLIHCGGLPWPSVRGLSDLHGHGAGAQRGPRPHRGSDVPGKQEDRQAFGEGQLNPLGRSASRKPFPPFSYSR